MWKNILRLFWSILSEDKQDNFNLTLKDLKKKKLTKNKILMKASALLV